MPVGMISTYDLTVGVQLQVEDLIHVISPFDTPLTGGNTAEGMTVLSRDSLYEKKYEWLDEELLVPRTTLGATYVTADTYITVATGERERFQTGDLIRTRGETMRVTGYGTTAETLTVTRAYAGTATNAGITGDALIGVGSALPEGSDPPSPRQRDRVNRYNLTEIFGPYAVQVSETTQVIRKYGLTMTEFDYQVANRTKEAWVAIEQAILYGTRVDDATNEWRSMGGFDYFITTNVDSTTTDLTEAKLIDSQQLAWNAGGAPTILMVPAAQKRKISLFDKVGNYLQVARDDRTRGQIVNFYESDFGVVTVVLNRWLRTSDVLGFNRDQATFNTLRPLIFEMLAKTGDSRKGQVVGEYGFSLKRQQHAFKMNALAA
jgi:hypothetical protein